jgi:hypothetical protein
LRRLELRTNSGSYGGLAAAYVRTVKTASGGTAVQVSTHYPGTGRTPRSLMLFVAQMLVSAVQRSTSPWRSLQNRRRVRRQPGISPPGSGRADVQGLPLSRSK